MAQPARPRHLYRRTYDRLRHASSNLKGFLLAAATTMSGTAALKTFTVDNTTDIFTSTSHGFTTGKGPVLVSNSGGALPAGLSATTWYWPIRIDANTFRLATSRANAAYGTAVNVTDNGSGTNSIRWGANAESLMERLRQKQPYQAIKGASDIDNL